MWLPGWYWTNFLLTTVVYIFVSYRIFKITATLRDACIPRDNAKIVGRLAERQAARALGYVRDQVGVDRARSL